MSIGRKDYEDRKEARIERLESKAAAASAESTAAYRRASEIAHSIPMGQPIIVGHHSERHARADQRRIERGMNKSVEAGKKADYYARRAQAAANNNAIRSDDPDAIEKLEEKLAALQAQHERDKAMNAYYRKHKTVKGFTDMDDERAAKIDAAVAELNARPYSSGKHVPVPSWVLSNRNGEMSRLKKRIEALRQVDQMEHVEIDFPGGQIVTNEDVNRVQILFDEKPDADMRSKLKRNGFRWSPSESAWQTLRTPAALRCAKRILHVE